nr:hypothetical protein [Tanacetum cinerariifolium]
MELYFVGTEYQLADLFTKDLLKERSEHLVHRIEIIMAQPQRQDDVHHDELCPPKKCYALMAANKKIDLDDPLDTIQLSIVEQKSCDDLEAHKNVENVKEHLVAREIEKMVEGTESKDEDEVDNSILNSQDDIGTRQQNKADMAKMIANAIQQEHENLQADITLQINNAINNHIPSHVDSSVKNYMFDNPQLQHNDLPIWLALKIKFEGLHAFNTPCKTFAIHPRDHDNPYDDAHPEGENSLKRQNTFKHGTYVFGESSSG